MTIPSRVAAIDIGTNTVLLLVAEPGPDGGLQAASEHATITRLGQGVDRTRTLHPDAIARTTACLDDYGAIVTRLGVERIAVVATSAMRDARGGEVIATHVKKTFGVDLRIIGGDEEAELTFSGALVGLPGLRANQNLTVFDIGGGSTEIVRGGIGQDRIGQDAIGEAATGQDRIGQDAIGEAATGDGADEAATGGAVTFKKSFDVGSVRLTERHVHTDPPSAAELEAIRAELRATFAELPPRAMSERGAAPIGIAGTMTTLAAVSMKMAVYDGARVHGHRLATTELRNVVEHLASLSLTARRQVPGLEPKRADVIVAGGLIALALLEHWGADSTVISDRGVRWGLAVALSRSAATV